MEPAAPGPVVGAEPAHRPDHRLAHRRLGVDGDRRLPPQRHRPGAQELAQQGQQWRILAALQQLVDEALAKAAGLREAAAAKRTRATDSQALLGRPFEHADKLKAALARQQQIDALMRAEAEAAAKAAAQAAAEELAEGAAAAG